MKFESTKIIELGSCAFRQWRASHSHCQFIHGYRLVSKFWFGCDTLDDKHWVVDFGGLDELKSLLHKQFDHTFCVSADDPELESFKQLHEKGICDLRIMDNGVGIERTAEFCLQLANNYIQHLTNGRCWVSKVEVWEHEKNSAIAEIINDVVTPEVTQPPVTVESATFNSARPNVPQPVAVGNKTTTGWSNLFGGTSWGV